VGIQPALEEIRKTTAELTENAKKWGGQSEPVMLTVANRLFGQQRYTFRQPFLALLRDNYGAPFQPMDFISETSAARSEINLWVEEQTRHRIRDLIPPNGLDRETRLVLVNAIYLKAPWALEFQKFATKPIAEHVDRPFLFAIQHRPSGACLFLGRMTNPL